MKVIEFFSERQKKLRGEVQDVYFYGEMPKELRIQVSYIFKDYLGDEDEYHRRDYGAKDVYKSVVDIMCREYGVFRLSGLPEHGVRNYFREYYNFILIEQDVERVLSAVELGCRAIDSFSRRFNYLGRRDADKGQMRRLQN